MDNTNIYHIRLTPTNPTGGLPSMLEANVVYPRQQLRTSVSTKIERLLPEVTASHTNGHLTIHDLGWTREEAICVREQFSSFADDWDDPSMDIYDEVYGPTAR